MKKTFQLVSPFSPSGDQPKAIRELVNTFRSAGTENPSYQTLLGVTGSGKTFTVAQVIAEMNRPALVLAHNKTLAAQLYSEFRELFPYNAVEYFVSYYDYYQPEAYIPATDTYIEKDSAINEQIDRMRHSATRSLFDRRDVIIVSSVSCIYGLGSPEVYQNMMIHLVANSPLRQDQLIRELVRIQYQRNNVDFSRGTIRVRGDRVEIFPPYEQDRALRVEFFGNYVESLAWFDPLTGKILESQVDQVGIYPGSHYATNDEILKGAIVSIREELRECLHRLKTDLRLLEAQRLEQRTLLDIEMMEQIGYCQGIENYSRHMTGRAPGAPPPTLLEYFPKDFILFIDESHVTIPQIGGMYRGDRMRKSTLVEHGFRLPSALDNRPLNFQEFENFQKHVVYISATPGDYELKKSGGTVVEQIIRPTGLVDPRVEVRPIKTQIEDLLLEIQKEVAKGFRVLITTLTKKSAEDLTEHYETHGVKVKYLHSEIETLERTEILRDLRLGVFDVLIGINLLREGLDLPEVSLVAITDADKEGFLRSERSLIQTIGRAARNAEGHVILYADRITQSMDRAIKETERRRQMQMAHNQTHGISPQTIEKKIREGIGTLFDGYEGPSLPPPPSKSKFSSSSELSSSKASSSQSPSHSPHPDKVRQEIQTLRKKMKTAAQKLEFEEAARLRDEVKRLEILELSLRG